MFTISTPGCASTGNRLFESLILIFVFELTAGAFLFFCLFVSRGRKVLTLTFKLYLNNNSNNNNNSYNNNNNFSNNNFSNNNFSDNNDTNNNKAAMNVTGTQS